MRPTGAALRVVRLAVLLAALVGIVTTATFVATAGRAAGPDAARVAAERTRLASAGLDAWIDRQERLARVSSRLRRGGADLCEPNRAPVSGVVAATFREIPEPYRDVAHRRLGVDDLVRVLRVLPGSAAERAGLLPGDTILAIDAWEIHAPNALESFDDDEVEPVRALRVERAGQILDLAIAADSGCGLPAALSLHAGVGVHREADEIAVHPAMLRLLESDDELAWMLAEVQARALLDDAGTPSETDALARDLLRAAGFDAGVGRVLKRRLAVESPLAPELRADYVPGDELDR